MLIQTLQGDCREILKSLPDNSVNCCVTSPPYFGLRDYGAAGQIGLEETPAEYVAALVEVFREVKRVLRPDGNCWLNLGDSYLNKQLLGIPWRVAFALQDIGFYLRSEVIWFKTNSMPESVNDRPTRCHEQIFLFTKSQNYFYDIDAIREPSVIKSQEEALKRAGSYKAYNNWEDKKGFRGEGGLGQDINYNPLGRNKRTVWPIALVPYSGSHFATFPEKLIEPCILAGCPAGGTVLDPFGGSGTTGRVAVKHGRNAILIELNPEYHKLIDERTDKVQGVMGLQ
jgi:DNA modification methylase